MEERNSLIDWIKEHKRELILAGISIGTLILIVLGIKNREAIKAVWDSLKATVKQPTTKVTEAVQKVIVEIPPEPIQETVTVIVSNLENLPSEVRRHIRNLPDGYHASPKKIAEALENNIILMDGQTWVEGYVKGRVAA